MAETLQLAFSTAGLDLYALLRNTAGEIADLRSAPTGEQFVTYATADLEHYDLPFTEQGDASGYYVATVPSWLAAGVYQVTVYEYTTPGTPAEGDTLRGVGQLEWDGTAVLARADLPTALLTATNGVETGVTLQAAQRLILAMLAGNIDVDPDTGAFTVRDINNTKIRVSGTGTEDGDRTISSVDAT